MKKDKEAWHRFQLRLSIYRSHAIKGISREQYKIISPGCDIDNFIFATKQFPYLTFKLANHS